jgi:hypothetical protein
MLEIGHVDPHVPKEGTCGPLWAWYHRTCFLILFVQWPPTLSLPTEGEGNA